MPGLGQAPRQGASTPTPSAATTSAAGVKLPRQVHSSEWSVRGEQLLAVVRVTARRSGRRRRRRGHLERGSIDRIADALSGPDADEHPMLGWSWRQDSSVRPPACRATCMIPATVRVVASSWQSVLPEDRVEPAPARPASPRATRSGTTVTPFSRGFAAMSSHSRASFRRWPGPRTTTVRSARSRSTRDTAKHRG